MRTLVIFAALIAAPAAAQEAPFVGEYRLAEGPDVGGGLLIHGDGRFQYMLAAGALDESAEGRWETHGDRICLTTDPKPVPPAMEKGAPLEVAGSIPTLLVTWPNGRGIAGVNFTIGFDTGDPIEDYTQYDGWTLPDGDPRIPRWVELREPIYGITAPRFELTAADNGRLRAIIIPNDIGVVDFDNACAEHDGAILMLARGHGYMRFVRVSGDQDAIATDALASPLHSRRK